MGSESSKPVGSQQIKPKPSPGLLSYPKDQYTFTISYHDYQDFMTKMDKVCAQIPSTEYRRYIKNRSKHWAFDGIEIWFHEQPLHEREELHKFFLEKISELGNGLSITKSTFSPESASSPEYGKYSLNISFNSAEEMWTKVQKVWRELPFEDRKRINSNTVYSEAIRNAKQFIDRKPEQERNGWKRHLAEEIMKL